MQSSLEKDIFDDAHAAQDIKNFEAREARMEKMLGQRFLTRVSPDESGSTISAINKKQHQKLVMDDFLQKVENDVRSQKKGPDNADEAEVDELDREKEDQRIREFRERLDNN